MIQRKKLEQMFKKNGYEDFKWIQPKDIVVAQWVRMKCLFGCPTYGKCSACPPNLPSVAETRDFFGGYRTGVVFHFPKKMERPEDRIPWAKEINRKLLELEREVFLLGYHKAFLLFVSPCRLCDSCAGSREKCYNPKSARPTPEGMGIDVFTTVRKFGYAIDVLYDYSQEMNRYAFLMIE